MEFLHLSTLIRDYFDGFPEPTRSYLYQGLYWLGALSVLFVIYRVARSENIHEAGKVAAVWYKPSMWFARFNAIKEQNRQQAPEMVLSLLEKFRYWSRWLSVFMLILLGLAWLAVGLVGWNANGWWIVLLGICFLIASFLMVKKLLSE